MRSTPWEMISTRQPAPGNDNGIYVRTVGNKTVVQYNQVGNTGRPAIRRRFR